MSLPRILFVGMQASPHVARWIDLVRGCGFDLHLFPVNGSEPLFGLRGVTVHWPKQRLFSVLRRGRYGRHVTMDSPDWPLVASASFRTRMLRRLGLMARVAGVDPAGTLARLRDRGLPGIPGQKRVVFRTFHPSDSELGGSRVIKAGAVRLGESEVAAPLLNGPGVLARVIREVQPNLIHSLEFQHSGYLTLNAKEQYRDDFPRWLATNWGSDILHFARFAGHSQQIGRLLRAIDFYSCECERDVILARQHGYAGPVLPVLPNSGGFDLPAISARRSAALRTSQRKLILVKGYQHFSGRALTALKALEACADLLSGFRILVYSAMPEPRARVAELRRRGILDINVLEWVPHDRILALFAQARLYVGIGVSDGISSSMLDAMAMGAFPIQTNTACCDEWFVDGLGGLAVSPHDFGGIVSAIRRALTDHDLVDRAAIENAKTVAERLDRDKLKPLVAQFYQQALS